MNMINHLIAAAQKVAQIKGIAASGFRTAINCNAEGGRWCFIYTCMFSEAENLTMN